MLNFSVIFACNWVLQVTSKIMKKKFLLLNWQFRILIAVYIKMIKNKVLSKITSKLKIGIK